MPGVVVHLELAVRPLAAVGQLGARRFELHEHVVGGAVEQLALLGEDEPAGVAVEQRDAELLLERARPAATPPTATGRAARRHG